MSAYKQIKTQITHLGSLTKALAACGFERVEVAADPRVNPLMLHGWRSVDRLAAAVKISRLVYGGYEDTGFYWDHNSQTYLAHVSTHDGGGSFGEPTLKRVMQQYARFEVERLAEENGWMIQEQATADGTIRLQLVHY